jgi:hypothetical protein
MEWTKIIKPGAPKKWLQLLAGLVWSCVGVYLVYLALNWICAPSVGFPWIYWIPGVVLASLIYYFGFSRLARKNSRRIVKMEGDKPCLFAFQAWHSYPLVIVMIGMGITLRKFTPIPKPLLGILYIGIGGGLALASLHYYQSIISSQVDSD